ncbi:MAG TPA: hypothetical protein VF345_03240 [Chthoniobacterales bacterium]
MKTFLTISVLALLSLTCVQAEQATAIELKNKSAFTMEASGRNPFWPIGWKPVAKANTTEHAGPEIQPSAFVVSSITLDKSGRFAIINGKAMQAGQQFGLQLGTQTYQLTVKAIEDGRVILLRRDEEIIIPLRRK